MITTVSVYKRVSFLFLERRDDWRHHHVRKEKKERVLEGVVYSLLFFKSPLPISAACSPFLFFFQKCNFLRKKGMKAGVHIKVCLHYTFFSWLVSFIFFTTKSPFLLFALLFIGWVICCNDRNMGFISSREKKRRALLHLWRTQKSDFLSLCIYI